MTPMNPTRGSAHGGQRRYNLRVETLIDRPQKTIPSIIKLNRVEESDQQDFRMPDPNVSQVRILPDKSDSTGASRIGTSKSIPVSEAYNPTRQI